MEDKIIEYLENNISKKRFNHILSVKDIIINLSQIYNLDTNKCILSALLHDITKEVPASKNKEIIDIYFKDEEISNIPPAWHSYTGYIFSKQYFNIKDKEVLEAVKYHTLGHKDMGDISKALYIADFIDPKKNSKDYSQLISSLSLNELTLYIIEEKLNYLKDHKKHIPNQTIEFYQKIKQLIN